MNIQNKALVSKNESIIKYNVKDVWDIVVDNENYEWRADIKKIKIMENGNKWIEYYDKKLKYFTEFTLLGKKEYKIYSFKMENKNFYGNWYGEFNEMNQNETRISFIEVIYIKKKIINILAKLFWNIKKKQEKYIKGLINELKKIK
jgi:hypothetical protein